MHGDDLQLVSQVRRHGRVDDVANERARRQDRNNLALREL